MGGKKRDDSLDESGDDHSAQLTLGALERLARLMRAAQHAEGLVPVHWETLRYLSRANRFSNSPGAVARFLGATKGTISQSVLMLEKRGYVKKQGRDGDTRSLSLALTADARKLLEKDPLLPMQDAIDALGGKTERRFSRAVATLLGAESARQKEPAFGTCLNCRFLDVTPEGRIRCEVFDTGLKEQEVELLCYRHEAAND